VLGSPIAHSLSPLLHRAAYAELGLDWDYQAHDVTEEGLPAFLDGLDESWRGLSLTMPLKRSVVPLLDTLTDRAEQALAANTVVLENRRRTGHNTDVPGVSAALRERYDGAVERAVIVGGGATAASAILGLADLGCRQVTLLVRDLHRAGATVETAARHPGHPEVDVRTLEQWADEDRYRYDEEVLNDVLRRIDAHYDDLVTGWRPLAQAFAALP
jgi:shikimate dehydrogenase